jgi:hypothetical protein
MPQFSYKAIDSHGKSIMGQIDALNFIDLEMRLKRMGRPGRGGQSKVINPFRADPSSVRT